MEVCEHKVVPRKPEQKVSDSLRNCFTGGLVLSLLALLVVLVTLIACAPEQKESDSLRNCFTSGLVLSLLALLPLLY